MLATPGKPWICSECGYRINGGRDPDLADAHECDERSVIRYAVERLESSFALFMALPEGEFAKWQAEQG